MPMCKLHANAFVYFGSEIPAMVEAISAGLAADGLQAGDVVALFAPNLIEYPLVTMATLRVGGVLLLSEPDNNAATFARYVRSPDHRNVVIFWAFNIVVIHPKMQ